MAGRPRPPRHYARHRRLTTPYLPDSCRPVKPATVPERHLTLDMRQIKLRTYVERSQPRDSRFLVNLTA